MKTAALAEYDLYLFHQGTNFHAYEMLGAHYTEQDGKRGVRRLEPGGHLPLRLVRRLLPA